MNMLSLRREREMKTYRNIQNQVLYNSNVIEDFLRGEKTIAEFGIHVIGKYDSWESVPADVKNNTYGSLEIGDCLLIGADAPYSYYVWTQNEDQTEWLNIGIFPQAGPKGDTGEQGPIGPAGSASKWYYGDTVPSSAAGYNEGDMWLTASNDVYSLTNGVWINRTNIKGATGPQGPQGNTGPRGPIGPRGERGMRGAQGAPYEIIGILATVDELQAITPQPNIGYFIGAAAPYDIYVSFGDQWLYVGDSGIDVSIYATKAELSDYVTLETLNDYDDSIKEYIDEKVPTKTSELTNDSGFATTTYVNGKVPTKTSQLENDSQFADVNDLTGVVTHCEEYTDTEIEDLRSSKATKRYLHTLKIQLGTNAMVFLIESLVSTPVTSNSTLYNAVRSLHPRVTGFPGSSIPLFGVFRTNNYVVAGIAMFAECEQSYSLLYGFMSDGSPAYQLDTEDLNSSNFVDIVTSMN